MQTELDGTESEITDLEQQITWQRRYQALIMADLDRGIDHLTRVETSTLYRRAAHGALCSKHGVY